MNCGNCGKPLFAGSTICPVCGVDNANLVNNQSVSNNSMIPPQEQILNNGEFFFLYIHLFHFCN